MGGSGASGKLRKFAQGQNPAFCGIKGPARAYYITVALKKLWPRPPVPLSDQLFQFAKTLGRAGLLSNKIDELLRVPVGAWQYVTPIIKRNAFRKGVLIDASGNQPQMFNHRRKAL
jgi:hypothetical protein